MASNQMEICLKPAEPALSGQISAEVYEVGGSAPTTIIKVGQEWGVKINWELTGSLLPFICGTWCVQLFMESIGEGPEFNLPQGTHHEIKFDGCRGGKFEYDFKVAKDLINSAHCQAPYKVVAAVTYKTVCGTPGPMAGFVEGPIVSFYKDK